MFRKNRNGDNDNSNYSMLEVVKALGILGVVGALLSGLAKLAVDKFAIDHCPSVIIGSSAPGWTARICLLVTKNEHIERERGRRLQAKGPEQPNAVSTPKSSEPAPSQPPIAAPSTQQSSPRTPISIATANSLPAVAETTLRALCGSRLAIPTSENAVSGLNAQICAIGACGGEQADPDAAIEWIATWHSLARDVEREACSYLDRDALTSLKSTKMLYDMLERAPIPERQPARGICRELKDSATNQLHITVARLRQQSQNLLVTCVGTHPTLSKSVERFLDDKGLR
jgi:hypothetical protein